jgi:hypothetical protein
MRSFAFGGWLITSVPGRRVERVTILFVGLFIPIAAYAVFRLPLWSPPTGRIASSSVVFGFNNGVAIACVVALLGTATAFHLWRRSGAPDQAGPVQWFSSRDIPNPGRIRWKVFVLMAVAHGLLTVVMWANALTSNVWRIDFEASHFLWRLYLMELFGARPYLDFQHEYGPALLYIPLLAHRLLAPAGMSLEAAYYLAHFACSVAGLGAIAVILDHAHMSRARKEVAFCLLGAAGLLPYMGLNGNLIRYAPPYLSVILADRAMRLARGWAGPLTVVSVLGVVNILISPEIAVGFYLGWGAYCALTALTDRPRAVLGVAGLAVAGVLGALMLPPEYAGSVLSFSGGANNFPLVPAAHIVFYLTILFLGVPPLLADILSGRARPRALLLAMATICVVMIPGALTRADPPHVLFFSLGLCLLLFVQAAIRSRRIFALYAVLYAVVIVGGTHVSNARAFYGASLQSLRPANIVAFISHQEPGLTERQLARLERYPALGLPFCSYGVDRRTMAYLWSRRQIDPEYYCGIIGVYTEAQLSRKIADTTRHDYLLVRKGWLGPVDPCLRHLAIVRNSFIIYAGPLWCRREALETDLAVNRAIIAHYRAVEDLGPYVVMKRAADG